MRQLLFEFLKKLIKIEFLHISECDVTSELPQCRIGHICRNDVCEIGT